jgi:large subunit ribosomal protein L18
MATKKIKPLKLRHTRLRKKVSGTPERPRLAVHFSGKNITAQVIDDESGKTLASANTTEKGPSPKGPRQRRDRGQGRQGRRRARQGGQCDQSCFRPWRLHLPRQS